MNRSDEARLMAKAWKLNDERNKRLAAEAAEAKKRYAAVDDPNQE
jgi:hypothetical protein